VEQAVETLAAELNKVATRVIVLEHHVSEFNDTLWNADTEATRNEYNVFAVPAVVLNGTDGEKILWSPTYDDLKAEVFKILNETSEASFIPVTIPTSGKITANGKLKNVSNKAIENARLYAVIYEDIGTSRYHYVVRDITPATTISKLTPGNTLEFSLASNISYNKNRKYYVVIILKSIDTGMVLQSFMKKA